VTQHKLVAKSRLPQERERGQKQKTHSKRRMVPTLFWSMKVQALPRAAGGFMVAILLPLAPGA
jgi:hypothetical protein